MSNSEEQDGVRFPAIRLFSHIFTKGFQAGAVIGSGLLIPAYYLYGTEGLKDRTTKVMSYSAVGGVTLAGTLGLVKFVGMDKEGLEERAYRIKYNESQNRLDHMNTCFGIFGAGNIIPVMLTVMSSAGTMALMYGPDPYSLVTGFSFGTLAAVMAYTLTSDHKTDVGKIVHELKY